VRKTLQRFFGSRWTAAAEILLVAFVFIPYTITPVVFLLAWVSLWLRQQHWSTVGLKRPRSWIRTLSVAIPLGVAWPYADIFFVEPWIESLTGVKVDLSLLVGIQDNLTGFLIIMAIVWTVATFGEELVFRGYLLNRLQDVTGRGWVSVGFGLIASAAAFGYAHMYQGISGMIEAAYVAVALGTLYLASGRNLWLPMLVHGFYDTVGITLLYLGKYPGQT
jgi:hypothetical protein